MHPDMHYAPHRPIAWLVCDKKGERLPSLLLHVDQGDYFGTLATILNFVQEDIAHHSPRAAKSKIPRLDSVRLLRGMCDDLSYLQRKYDIVKKKIG